MVALGFSGAWISNLAVFEPYQPIFIGAALVALFFAWQRIWQSAPTCAPGEVCATPKLERATKLLFGVVCALLLAALTLPYIAPWFY